MTKKPTGKERRNRNLWAYNEQMQVYRINRSLRLVAEKMYDENRVGKHKILTKLETKIKEDKGILTV